MAAFDDAFGRSTPDYDPQDLAQDFYNQNRPLTGAQTPTDNEDPVDLLKRWQRKLGTAPQVQASVPKQPKAPAVPTVGGGNDDEPDFSEGSSPVDLTQKAPDLSAGSTPAEGHRKPEPPKEEPKPEASGVPMTFAKGAAKGVIAGTGDILGAPGILNEPVRAAAQKYYDAYQNWDRLSPEARDKTIKDLQHESSAALDGGLPNPLKLNLLSKFATLGGFPGTAPAHEEHPGILQRAENWALGQTKQPETVRAGDLSFDDFIGVPTQQQSGYGQMQSALESAANAVGPTPADVKANPNTASISETMGRMGPAIVAGIGGSALLGPEAGVAAGAAAMGLQGGSESFDDAVKKGATPEQAARAAGYNALASGALGTVSFGVAIKPFIERGLGGAAAHVMERMAEGGITFSTTAEVQEYVAKHIEGSVYGKQYEEKLNSEKSNLRDFQSNIDAGPGTAADKASAKRRVQQQIDDVDDEIHHIGSYSWSTKRFIANSLTGGALGLLFGFLGRERQKNTRAEPDDNTLRDDKDVTPPGPGELPSGHRATWTTPNGERWHIFGDDDEWDPKRGEPKNGWDDWYAKKAKEYGKKPPPPGTGGPDFGFNQTPPGGGAGGPQPGAGPGPGAGPAGGGAGQQQGAGAGPGGAPPPPPPGGGARTGPSGESDHWQWTPGARPEPQGPPAASRAAKVLRETLKYYGYPEDVLNRMSMDELKSEMLFHEQRTGGAAKGGGEQAGPGTQAPPPPRSPQQAFEDETLRKAGHSDADIAAMSEDQRADALAKATGRPKAAPGKRDNPVNVEQPDDLETAPQQPHEPTPGQAEAGNYQHQHAEWQGMPIAVETAKGQVRRGVDENGKPWEVPMPAAYGRFKGIGSAEGRKEGLDVFMGPTPDSPHVFIVNQRSPKTGGFDEHKVMAGFPNAQSAVTAYLDAHDKSGPDRFGGLAAMSVDDFKKWVKKPSNLTKPASSVLPPEVGQQHILSVENTLKAVGMRPQDVSQVDIHRAAEIHAEQNIPPHEAFVKAVVQDAWLKGMLSKLQIHQIYEGTMDHAIAEVENEPKKGRAAPVGGVEVSRPAGGVSVGQAGAPPSGGEGPETQRRPTAGVDLSSAGANAQGEQLPGGGAAGANVQPEAGNAGQAAETGVAGEGGRGRRPEAPAAERPEPANGAERPPAERPAGNAGERPGAGEAGAEAGATKPAAETAEGAVTHHGNYYTVAGDLDALGRLERHEYREFYEAQLAPAIRRVDGLKRRIARTKETGQDPLVKGPLGRAEIQLSHLQLDLRAAEGEEKITRRLIAVSLPHPTGQIKTPVGNFQGPAGGAIPHEDYKLEHIIDTNKQVVPTFRKLIARDDALGELLRAADKKFTELVHKVNDAGFSHANINSFNAKDFPEVREAKRELSSIGGTVSRLVIGVARTKFDLNSPRVQQDIGYVAEALGQKPEAPAPKWTEVGKNEAGQTLYEDKNGVRSYVENGVRVTEPVGIRPTRAGVAVERPVHKDEWRTEKERTERIEEADEVTKAAPQIALANEIYKKLTVGDPVTNKILQSLGEKFFGGTLAEGKFDRKKLYDALELAVNKAIIARPTKFRLGGDDWREPLQNIDILLSRVPKQTVRSEEQQSFQQFSTPPTYAAAVAWAANLRDGDVMLEPSAGTGSIIAAAVRPGVKVYANELAADRAALVKDLPVEKVFRENAEQLNNILPKDVRPSVVLMNPPFSQTAGRMGDKKVLETGATHVEQALKRLQPGGRLVSIVGGGMSMDAPTFRDWWHRIGKEYAVRANIPVEREVYAKYGTTFPTRLIIIDKATPAGESPVTEPASSIPDLMRLLEPIRNGRQELPASSEQRPAEPSGAETAKGGESGRPAAPPVSPESGRVGAGEPSQGGLAGEPELRPEGTTEPPVRMGGEQRPPLAGEQSERPEPTGTETGIPSGVGGAKPAEGGGIRPEPGVREAAGAEFKPSTGTERVEIENAAPGTQRKTDAISESLYESYQPQKLRIKGAKPHPGPLVESASMASVTPPDVSYKPKIPSDLIEKGGLSLSQMEPVIYAGQAHNKLLPAPEGTKGARRGFFIGDGTGVGKGREVAGIILDNFNQGRTRAVWVSETKALMQDAKRDWRGLDQDPNLIFDLGKVKTGEPIKAGKGIGFITYDTLKGGMSDQAKLARGNFIRKQSVNVDGRQGIVQRIVKIGGKGVRGGEDQVTVKFPDGQEETFGASRLTPTEGSTSIKTRVDQIADWFGADFDGVIAFDEAHNMGNSSAVKGDRGNKDASQKALAGIDLQNRLPNARVVYVSATGATEVSNLGYAQRLGLWGRGTPFASRENFISEVQSGGIAAMELIARDLKQLGGYIARNLSYDGVEYERLLHKLDGNQREIYDDLAGAWQVVLQNINKALEDTNADRDARAKSAAISAFWGAHQRFFNQIITSLQMPSVTREVKKDIDAGRQVVIQLTNTNEASQERAAAKAETAEDLEDLDITPRDGLIQLIEKSFPTQQYEEYVDEDGRVRVQPVVDAEGKPVQNADAVAAREALIERLASIKVPQGPLDLILDQFGIDTVAEVTGRGRRFVLKPDEQTGRVRRVEESRPASANIAETDAFQSGKKKILVFSQAGGTGRSYHAENGTDSAKARRSHYLVQGGWRADKAVQGFGRTHRTNQASAPIFRLVTTDIEGQKRFISSIARRLAQLGALTKGQREAGDQGIFSARDNLESVEARDALRQFTNDLINDKIPGIDLDEFERQTGLRFVQRDDDGRVLGANFNPPEITQFLNRLLSMTLDKQNATFDAFSERLDGVIEAKRQAGKLDSGLETIRAEKIRKDEEQVVFTNEEGANTKHVKLTLSDKLVPIPYKFVASSTLNPVKRWIKSKQGDKIYAVTNGPTLTAEDGKITSYARITNPVSGSRVIPEDRLGDPKYWDVLGASPASLAAIEARWNEEIKNAPPLIDRDLHLITGTILPIWDRLKGSTRVVRLQTDDGERLLGRVIPNSQVAATLKALGAEAKANKVSPDELHKALLQGGQATLANGWRMMRRTVAGESRIELVGPATFSEGQEVKNDGVFTERIDYKTRYFIPIGADGPKVLERLIKYRPITEFDRSGGADQPFLSTSPSLRPRIEPRVSMPEKNPGWTFIEPEVESRVPQIKEAVEDIINRTLGRNVEVSLERSRSIHVQEFEGMPAIRGAYYPKSIKGWPLIRLALEHQGGVHDGAIGVTYHETWHALEDLLGTDREQDLLERETPRLRQIVADQYKSAGVDNSEHVAAGLHPTEVRAEAYRLFAQGRDSGGFGSEFGLHLGLRRFFEKVWKFLRSIANALRGLGFNTAEDIFGKGYEGRMRNRPQREESGLARAMEKAKKPQEKPFTAVSPKMSPEEKSVHDRIFAGQTKVRIPKDFNAIYTRTKDDLWPAHVVEKALSGGRDLPAAISPYKLMRLTRGVAGEVDHWLKHGTFDYEDKGKITGPSLAKVLEPVDGDIDRFLTYALSKRALELDDRGKRTGIPRTDAEAVVRMGAKKFEPVFRDLVKYQDRALQYLVDSGILNGEQAAVMQEANKDYVPFYRFMGDNSELGHSLGASFKVWSPIRAIKGSERQIINPIESIVKNTATYITLAERNRALRALEDLANSSTVGKEFLQRVMPKKRPINVTVDEINRHLDREGIDEEASDPMLIFRPMPFRPEPDQFAVWRDGKRRVYRVGQELANAINSLDRDQLNLATRILALPARWLRAGATLAPEFMVRNPIRDQFSAMAFSPKGYVPVYDFVRGLGAMFNKSEDYLAWLSHGGANANLVSLDRNYIIRNVVNMGTPPAFERVMRAAKTPIELLRNLSEAMENATRVGAGVRSLQHGSDPYDAAFETREATLDFARIGSQMKTINAIIPFFNAQAEGIDRAARALSNPKTRFAALLTLAAGITLPSILLWYLNKDDPRIRELPAYVRDFNWLFPTNSWVNITDKEAARVPASSKKKIGDQWMENKGAIYKLPKPFELGVLFGSIQERVLEAAFANNPHPFEGIGTSVRNAILPNNWLPQFALPMIEQASNYSFFTDRKLIPGYLQDKRLPQYQTEPFTSQTAKTIGNLISKINEDTSFASPLVIENYIRQWTGGLGMTVLQTVDKGIDLGRSLSGAPAGPPRPESTLSDIPVIRAFVQRFPTAQTISIQSFYDTYGKMQKDEGTYRYLLNNRQYDDAKEFRNSHPDVNQKGYINEVHKALGNQNKAIRDVYSDMKMTPRDKRQLIDSIYLQMIETAKGANVAIEKRLHPDSTVAAPVAADAHAE